jgi:tetratricopeptide (TPR) repeat protein
MRDFRCHASAEEIAQSLIGNYRQEHLFSLKQAKGDTLMKSILITGLLCLAVSTLQGTGQAQSEVDEAASLRKQASQYKDQERYGEAEPLYKRALAIREKALGPDHPDTATSLDDLAFLYQWQRKYAEAEQLYKRALAIRERALGPDHPDTATSLNNLAFLYQWQEKYAEAEPLYKRALAIGEKAPGPDAAFGTIIVLNNLAELYRRQKKYAEAEPFYKRAIAVYEKGLDYKHPIVLMVLTGYADLLREMGRGDEAARLGARAAEIRAKVNPKMSN